jgi:N-acetylglucosamine-6-sulfatase
MSACRASAWRNRLGALAACALMACARAGSPSRVGSEAAERPNVVVIMTDDQTVESLRVMPSVQRLLAGEGVTFTNSIVSDPLCCPSRATFLTGQYAHNHGVLANRGPRGGYDSFAGQDTTLPVALRRAGYRTIHIGKYLNGYGKTRPHEIPPGWDAWHASIGATSRAGFDYRLNENGRIRAYGADESDFKTDVYARLAERAIRREAHRPGPFFLQVAVVAPHSGEGSPLAEAAPRHRAAFADEPLPALGAFDEADVSDKPEFLRALPPLTAPEADAIAARYRARLASLLAVDDAVARIGGALRETSQGDETVVVFTSDNGFLQGEHRIEAGKRLPYEASVRVPLVVRGPGVATGGVSDSVVANVDLAPTIIELAGARRLRAMDGRSLVPLLRDPTRTWGRVVLLEARNAPKAVSYAGVRTDRYKYVEYETGERELYDLAVDPDELENRAGDPAVATVERELADTLEQLRACVGRACRRLDV